MQFLLLAYVIKRDWVRKRMNFKNASNLVLRMIQKGNKDMPFNDMPDGELLPLEIVESLSTREEKLKDMKVIIRMVSIFS